MGVLEYQSVAVAHCPSMCFRSQGTSRQQDHLHLWRGRRAYEHVWISVHRCRCGIASAKGETCYTPSVNHPVRPRANRTAKGQGESCPTYLANVAIIPGHKKTTLAIPRPLSLYLNGLPPYNSNSLCALPAFVPVTYALFVARIIVNASAADSVKQHASTEQARQAILTALDSCRSGQKRSKKKAEPKMVAT